MVTVKIVKRCLILTLTAIVVISSLLFFGCGEKEPTPTEKQVMPRLSEKEVIEITQEYLISQPGQLYCWVPENFTQMSTCARFKETIIQSSIDCSREDERCFLDGSVSIQFCEPSSSFSVPIAALRKLAKYDGDGFWSVNICGEWLVNDATGRVIAKDEEAIKLLEDLNLKSYTNQTYGYCIRYPASWSLVESGQTVYITCSLQEGLTIGILPKGTLPASDFKLIFDNMTTGLRNEVRDFQLISKSQLSGIGDDAWEIVYTGKTEDNSAFITKFRVILYKYRLYGITALSTASEFTTELESAINSFTLLK